jgi:hypothetical protein
MYYFHHFTISTRNTDTTDASTRNRKRQTNSGRNTRRKHPPPTNTTLNSIPRTSRRRPSLTIIRRGPLTINPRIRNRNIGTRLAIDTGFINPFVIDTILNSAQMTSRFTSGGTTGIVEERVTTFTVDEIGIGTTSIFVAGFAGVAASDDAGF